MAETFVTKDVELNEELSLRGAKLLSIKTVGKNPGLVAGRRSIKEYTFVNDELFKTAMADIKGKPAEKEVEADDEDIVAETPKKKKGKK